MTDIRRPTDVTKRKDLKWPLTAGFTCFAIAIIGFAMSGTNGNMATALYVCSVHARQLATEADIVFSLSCSNAVGGIGFSAPLILLVTLVQLSTPPLFIGIASALTISVRTLGGVVGYAIAEAIYASKTNTQIPEAISKLPIETDSSVLEVDDRLASQSRPRFPSASTLSTSASSSVSSCRVRGLTRSRASTAASLAPLRLP